MDPHNFENTGQLFHANRQHRARGPGPPARARELRKLRQRMQNPPFSKHPMDLLASGSDVHASDVRWSDAVRPEPLRPKGRGAVAEEARGPVVSAEAEDRPAPEAARASHQLPSKVLFGKGRQSYTHIHHSMFQFLNNSKHWMDNVGVDPSLIQDLTQLDLEKAVEEHEEFDKKVGIAYAEV